MAGIGKWGTTSVGGQRGQTQFFFNSMPNLLSVFQDFELSHPDGMYRPSVSPK